MGFPGRVLFFLRDAGVVEYSLAQLETNPMPFDHDTVESALSELAVLPEAARTRVAGHLYAVLELAMGRRSRGESATGVWTRLRRVLFMRGVLRLPPWPAARKWTGLEDADERCPPERLESLLEEYLALVQAGELCPAPHPYLGEIGVDGWSRFLQKYIERILEAPIGKDTK